MKLPLLLSVPHAGLRVPDEVAAICLLDEAAIAADGDEGAAAIYFPLRDAVAGLVTTDVARAIVDQNRAPDDFGKDGIVKTHTCWDVPVYRQPPGPAVTAALIDRYYRPYHRRLRRRAAPPACAGVDCHTMAATAPPVAPDAGAERPLVCLSDGDGTTCRGDWVAVLLDCLRRTFDGEVAHNRPFIGGYITRTYARRLPFVQLEVSRTPRLSAETKSDAVRRALTYWCRTLGWIA